MAKMNRPQSDIFRAKIQAKLQSLKERNMTAIQRLKTQNNVNLLKQQLTGRATPHDSDAQKAAQEKEAAAANVAGSVPQQNLQTIISQVWLFQQNIIELADFVSGTSRLRLLLIYFQAALTIVINAYNLAMFLINYGLSAHHQKLSVTMSFVFYGHQIVCAAMNVLISVVGFVLVYNSIQSTLDWALKFNLYTVNEALKMQLLQFATHVNSTLRKYSVYGLFDLDGSFITAIISGTVTYIIIFMQYGEKDAQFSRTKPSNGTM